MTAPSAGPAKEEPRKDKDVGSILKERRALRGQSLETAHQHTRIPKKFLQALEDNAFDVFPAPVYLRGFLKGYCDFLDVEFEPLWAQLAPKPTPPPSEGGSAPTEGDRAAAPPETAKDKPSSQEPEAGARFSLQMSESTVLPTLIFAALVVMGGLMWALKSKPRPRPEQPAAHSTAEAPAQQPAVPAAPGQPSVSTATAQPTAPSAASTGETAPAVPAPRQELGTLRLTALRGTWIRLETDGRLVFEGQLPAGATQDFKARREFRLRIADPRALQAALDGTPTDLLKVPAASDGTRTLSR